MDESSGVSTPPQYLCAERSFVGALYTAAYGTGGVPPPQLKPLLAIVQRAKRAGRPVILFVEAARTNGDAVLEFAPEVRYFLHCTALLC